MFLKLLTFIIESRDLVVLIDLTSLLSFKFIVLLLLKEHNKYINNYIYILIPTL